MQKFVVCCVLIMISVCGYPGEVFTRTLKLMGSRFEITVVAADKTEGEQFIQMAIDEISRIERLISEWDPNTQTSSINQNAGFKPVNAEPELFDLIERSIQISKLTDGAFDISFAAIDQLWKFDGSMTRMPDAESIKQSVSKIGYENIIMNKEEGTVFLKLPGMKIGFGAIGKGYAADKAKTLLMENGVVAGMINASGDLNCWGNKPDGSPWLVGITNPVNKDQVFSWFPVDNSAVVTSGNYEKYVIFDGIRYAHIIDPRTGYPTQGLASVTVFAPKAELADALATSVFVMGKETGLDFIDQLTGIECIMVDDIGKIYYSKNIKRNTPEK
ncbi:FAD:protein FMN transferase [Gaoshiqia sp. Z1-71]|uniref:FAD:protein FMN transferase n=1 Tax=Gaoshiqia hydrogeniformans TaxID=3290090 RepID=UPI003BF80F89